MRVLGVVSDDGLRSLRRQLPSSWLIDQVETVNEFSQHVDRATAIIIDPIYVTSTAVAFIMRRIADAGRCALLYSEFNAAACSAVCLALLNGPAEVLFHDADAEPLSLRRALADLPRLSVPSMVLSARARALARLPDDVRMALLAVFGGHRIPRSVDDVCTDFGLHRRALERVLSATRFTTPRRILSLARLARTWPSLRRAETIDAVAPAAGFGSARAMRAQCNVLLGLNPHELRKSLTASDLAENIAMLLAAAE
jgi:methylphosphotriester-DNA--protein-cysteine methyltransferase